MSLAPDDPRHGTTNAYANLDCRCQRCRKAWALDKKRMQDDRAARLALDPTLATHGKPDTYGNWKCRCDACTAAHAARQLAMLHRRKASARSV